MHAHTYVIEDVYKELVKPNETKPNQTKPSQNTTVVKK
jgi:hypothetical protein